MPLPFQRRPNEDEIPLLPVNETQNKIKNTQKVAVVAGLIDSASITSLFLMMTTQTMRLFLEEVGKSIIFPAAAAFSFIQAVLAWRQAQLDGGKTGTVVRAVVATVTAAAIITAVVGAMAASTVFGAISPIIFTATLGANTLFHAGSAAYYWGKSAGTNNKDKATEYREKAKTNAVQAAALTLSTIAVATVMVFGKVALAGIGIAAGVFNMLFLATKAYQLFSGRKAAAPVVADTDAENDNEAIHSAGLANTADLSRALGDPAIEPSLAEDTKAAAIAPTAPSVKTASSLRRNKNVGDLTQLWQSAESSNDKSIDDSPRSLSYSQ